MTNLLIPDLVPSTPYAVEVRAVRPDGTSEWSRRALFTTVSDTVLPLAPVNVTWAVSGDSFAGSWDTSTLNTNSEVINIVRYEVELVANGLTRILSVNQTTGSSVYFNLSYEDNRQLFGTPQPTVTLRVRAVSNIDTKSAWTSVLSASNPVPGAPTAVTAVAGTNQIPLSWTAPSDTDIIGYNVYIGAVKVTFVNATTWIYATTTYSPTVLIVKTVDKFNQESVAANSNSVTPVSPTITDTVAPNTPTSLAATITNNANGLGARAAVSWVMASPPSDLAGYYVRFRRVGDTNYSTVPFTKDVLAGTIELQAAYTNYEFQINAYDWSNNTSAWSTTVTATSPSNAVPANVTGLTSVAGKDSITYSWTATADTDLKNYELTFSTSPTFALGNTTFFTGSATSLTVGGLTTGTTYYARVRAVDNAGQSSAAFSSTDTKTTGTFPTANSINLTSTTQVLTSPSGGGTTTPATASVTGAATGTTISVYDYSVDGAAFSTSVPAGVSRTGNVVTITGSTMTARTIAVRMGDGTISDTLTVAKNFDGATGSTGGTGGTGPAGADAYTVLLSNEAQTFSAGTTNANAGSTTSTVIAYKGTVAQTATVGAITGGATGISAAVTNNGTTAPLITFTVTTALVTANGTFSIPITVGGITFTQTFSWSLSFTGAQGTAGAAASIVDLVATSQALVSPSGGGATTPATSTITGTATNTTISTWTYSVDGGTFSGTLPAGVGIVGNVVTITGSTMTAKTIAVRATGASGVTDTMTVAKVSDGATGGTGGTGPAGNDGYTVLLSNESQTFPAGTTNALAGSTTSTVMAYKGTVLQTATVGTITGGATGITAAVTNNGTTAPLITFTVTTALSTNNGTFTIPITVGGITFNQVFSWSLAYSGAAGSAGTSATSVEVGNDAVAIPVTAAGAALSSGTITIPFSGWIGATRAAATLATSVLPAGITLGSNTAATTGADGTLVLNYASGATIGAADTGNITLTITCNSQAFTNIFSWTRAYTGAAGGTGSAGTSATSLNTTPDVFMVPTDSTGLATTTSSVVVNFKGYVGSTLSAVTIGTPPTLPAGITATPSGSGTTNAFITFNWTTGATIGAAASGTFAWPLTVNGISFTANIGWARALQGSTGPAGAASDGIVPAAAGTPSVIGRLNSLYVTWAPVTLNNSGGAQNDAVTYEIHLSTTTGFTPSGATKVTEVSGTSAMISNLPGTTTALSYGTTYFIKLIAKDRDGSAAASAQGSGQISKVASTDVTSIGADLIVPGTGFVNALVVNTGGSIQSSNYSASTAGWKIAPTGIEMNDSGSTIKAEAIKAGILGGASGSGIIQIATGTSLIFNGGYLKSNTYTGTTQATNPSGAGFYLGNDGLRIDQGIVSSSALTTGTITSSTITLGASGIIQSSDYSGGVSGFKLDSAGLVIRTGTISAAALLIQSGVNLIDSPYADFEYLSSYYTGKFGTSGSTVTIDTTQSYFNAQSLKIVAGGGYVYFGGPLTSETVVTLSAGTYIVSWYAKNTSGTSTLLQPALRNPTPTDYIGTSTSIPANSAWTRYSSAITVPGAEARYGFYFGVGTGGSNVYVDGIQIERQMGALATPSPWAPPGSTRIDGGMIRTGSITSTATAQIIESRPVYGPDGVIINYSNSTFVNDPAGRPAWTINATGAAEFSNLVVRGNAVVGSPNTSTYVFADPQIVVANTTSGSPNLTTASVGLFKTADVGLGITGAGIPAGTVIVQYIDGSTVKISANATATATGVNTTVARVKRQVSAVSSANYIPGSTGWTIRSDGFAEFRDLAADSVNATVLQSNSVNGDHLASVISVNSTLTFGTSLSLSTAGIIVSGTQGDTIFPTDGSDTILRGTVSTNSLTVGGNFALRGTTNELGKGSVLTAQSGTTPPAAGPQVSAYYPTGTVHQGYNGRGIVPFPAEDAISYLMTESISGNGVITKMAYNSSTASYEFAWANWGITTDGGRPEVTSALGGITVVGTEVYVLCETTEAYPGTYRGRWYLYQFHWNGTGTPVSGRFSYVRRILFETAYEGATSTWRPAIGYDGTNILIVQANVNGHWVVNRFTTACVYVDRFPLTEANGAYVYSPRNMSGIVGGSYNGVSNRWYITSEDYSGIYVHNPAVPATTRDVVQDWQAPVNQIYGLSWNGSRFIMRSATANYWFSNITDTDLTSNAVNVAQTWRVHDATDTLTATVGDFAKYETTISPITTLATFPRRAYMRISSVASIPNDPTDVNSANALTFYVARGSSLASNFKRIAPPAIGVVSITLDTIPTTGLVPPTITSFLTSSPAVVRSAGTAPVTGDNLWRLHGDGAGKVGPFEWSNLGVGTAGILPGMIQQYAGVTLPAGSGWLVCDGQSYLRATYPALAAALGHPVGGAETLTLYWGAADATHFNVPNLTGRVAVGLNTADADVDPYNFSAIGKTGGHKYLQSHRHTHGGQTWAWGASGDVYMKARSTANIIDAVAGVGGGNAIFTFQGAADWADIAGAGGGNAQNVQPYAVMYFIIKI